MHGLKALLNSPTFLLRTGLSIYIGGIVSTASWAGFTIYRDRLLRKEEQSMKQVYEYYKLNPITFVKR